MKSLHLLISGRVQGVGFRDWLIHEATKRGLAGWVRNVNHDKVEAVIYGQDDGVDDCAQRCWQGPNLAKVNDISITDTPPPSETGFTRRSSVS
jgi:acylphosphatase